jgi:hypothetical protein
VVYPKKLCTPKLCTLQKNSAPQNSAPSKKTLHPKTLHPKTLHPPKKLRTPNGSSVCAWTEEKLFRAGDGGVVACPSVDLATVVAAQSFQVLNAAIMGRGIPGEIFFLINSASCCECQQGTSESFWP